MTYKELRKRLRAEGFINIEIAAIQVQYLVIRAMGVADDDMAFDHEHGVVVHKRAKHILDAAKGRRIAVDVERHTAFDVDAC